MDEKTSAGSPLGRVTAGFTLADRRCNSLFAPVLQFTFGYDRNADSEKNVKNGEAEIEKLYEYAGKTTELSYDENREKELNRKREELVEEKKTLKKEMECFKAELCKPPLFQETGAGDGSYHDQQPDY